MTQDPLSGGATYHLLHKFCRDCWENKEFLFDPVGVMANYRDRMCDEAQKTWAEFAKESKEPEKRRRAI